MVKVQKCDVQILKVLFGIGLYNVCVNFFLTVKNDSYSVLSINFDETFTTSSHHYYGLFLFVKIPSNKFITLSHALVEFILNHPVESVILKSF